MKENVGARSSMYWSSQMVIRDTATTTITSVYKLLTGHMCVQNIQAGTNAINPFLFHLRINLIFSN